MSNHLIKKVVQNVNLPQRAPLRSTPAKSSVILQRNILAPIFDHRFHYQSVVIKIKLLKKCMQVDIFCVTHLVARFCKYPCRTHGTAIKHLAVYLRRTRDNELILDRNCDNSFEVYADADFCRKWYRPIASDEPFTT